MRHSLFYPSVIGFIAGVFIRSVWNLDTSVAVFICVTALGCCIYNYYSHNLYVIPEIKKYSLYFIASIFIFYFSLGVVRYSIFVQASGDTVIKKWVDQPIEFDGLIISEPDERAQGTRFVVEIKSLISTFSEKYDLTKTTRVLLLDEHYSSLKYGDLIHVKGIITTPENFETDTGREFDYVSYLKKDKIYYEITYPQIDVLKEHQGSYIKEKLFDIKNSFMEKLNSYIPFPESRFGAGITIAGKKALPDTIQQQFKTTGTLQVVVLSGYNITIVAEAFMALSSIFPLIISSSIGIVGIVLFTIMAGGSATIVRGSVMAILVIISKIIRRRYSVIRSLIVAGISMLFLNPMLLVYDPSFQLSFLATLGLIVVSPLLEKRFERVPERWGLRQAIASGIAAQLFVTPFLLYSSGEISIVALPANFLLSLLIPCTMLMCFMTGVTGFISMFLAVPLGYVAFVFLKIELSIVAFFSHIPYALLKNISFPLWFMTLVYMSFSVFIFRFYKVQNTEKKDMKQFSDTS